MIEHWHLLVAYTFSWKFLLSVFCPKSVDCIGSTWYMHTLFCFLLCWKLHFTVCFLPLTMSAPTNTKMLLSITESQLLPQKVLLRRELCLNCDVMSTNFSCFLVCRKLRITVSKENIIAPSDGEDFNKLQEALINHNYYQASKSGDFREPPKSSRLRQTKNPFRMQPKAVPSPFTPAIPNSANTKVFTRASDGTLRRVHQPIQKVAFRFLNEHSRREYQQRNERKEKTRGDIERLKLQREALMDQQYGGGSAGGGSTSGSTPRSGFGEFFRGLA